MFFSLSLIYSISFEYKINARVKTFTKSCKTLCELVDVCQCGVFTKSPVGELLREGLHAHTLHQVQLARPVEVQDRLEVTRGAIEEEFAFSQNVSKIKCCDDILTLLRLTYHRFQASQCWYRSREDDSGEIPGTGRGCARGPRTSCRPH